MKQAFLLKVYDLRIRDPCSAYWHHHLHSGRAKGNSLLLRQDENACHNQVTVIIVSMQCKYSCIDCRLFVKARSTLALRSVGLRGDSGLSSPNVHALLQNWVCFLFPLCPLLYKNPSLHNRAAPAKHVSFLSSFFFLDVEGTLTL